MPTIDPTAPAVVVSADSHVGPRLRHDLRPYCPSAYLDDFDAFADAMSGTADAETAARGLRLSNQAFRSGMRRSMDRSVDESQDRLLHPNGDRPGHYEPRARLEDMDADGVAAEIIYHASQNGEVLPFIGDVPVPQDERWSEYTDHAVVAYDIYNRWLADFCASDPKRLMGLAYIPVWDVDRCVETAKWARSAGLWGINFPSCSRPGARPYNDQVWDPFWAACVDDDLVLNTHASGGPLFDYFSGPGGSEIVSFEAGGYMAIRAIWHLIFGQVFDRFPDLEVVFTEVAELFYTATQWEMDGWYNRMGRTPLAKGMPSAYFPSNVYQGASFMSPHQAEHAWREGYAGNVVWGRDYPHREGCYQADLGTDDETFCRLTLRHVLSRVPVQEAIAMAGQNAVRAFGLDGDYLGEVASRIDAPTGEQLTTPVPADAYPITRPECRALTGAAGPRPVADEVMLHEHPVPA